MIESSLRQRHAFHNGIEAGDSTFSMIGDCSRPSSASIARMLTPQCHVYVACPPMPDRDE